MLLNTFEHGYSDAVAGKQCTHGAPQYREGYHEGHISKIRQKRELLVTFLVATIAALAMGAVMALSLAEAAGRLPV